MQARRKLQWLEDDLHFLRGIPGHTSSLPRCQSVPLVDSAPAAIGCAYVLEGATLGGQFLYKRFNARWGLTGRSGGRFFSGYGTRTARMWREFTGALNAVQLDRAGEAACVAAACSTFDTLTQWLSLPHGDTVLDSAVEAPAARPLPPSLHHA